MADRQALLDEEAAAEAEEEAAVDAHAEALAGRRASSAPAAEEEDQFDVLEPREGGDPPQEDGDDHDHDHDRRRLPTITATRITPLRRRTIADLGPGNGGIHSEPQGEEDSRRRRQREHRRSGGLAEGSGEDGGVRVEANAAPVEVERVEQVGSGEDALEELPSRAGAAARAATIRKVVERHQVILVQVVKEERGDEGAALTASVARRPLRV